MSSRRSVITLGTFDGVHRGHQAILRQVVKRARRRRATPIALAFGMPPRHAGDNGENSFLLTTLPEKLQILHRLGIRRVDVLRFNRKLASILPEDFFNRTIVARHRAAEMVVGPRVAFGKNRAGRLPLLKKLGRARGVEIHVVRAVAGHGSVFSSRRIRALLHRGDVSQAARVLGYPYSLSGRVVHGDHRGRRLGFPTANLRCDPRKILPPGVFWVKVLPDAVKIPFKNSDLRKAINGLCNVGIRPTFSPKETELHCEVFLFGAPRSMQRLYGRRLRVVFLRRLRRERKFASAAALKRQISKDFQLACRWSRH